MLFVENRKSPLCKRESGKSIEEVLSIPRQYPWQNSYVSAHILPEYSWNLFYEPLQAFFPIANVTCFENTISVKQVHSFEI